MDFVQETIENMQCVENENEGLRVNLADLESDNRQLISKNFRDSIIK